MAGIGGVAQRSSSRTDEEPHVVAPQQPSLRNKDTTVTRIRPGFTAESIVASAIADAARAHANAAPIGLADLSHYTDDTLDREIDRLRTRVEGAAAHTMQPERELLGLLEKEQLRRATAAAPPMVDAGTLTTKESLEGAIEAHARYLDRFGGRLADSVRNERQNYLNGLRAKLELVVADERICDNSKPTPISPNQLPGGAFEAHLTADDFVDALKKQPGVVLTREQEAAVRATFERWRRNECWQSGFDPTRFAPSGRHAEWTKTPSAMPEKHQQMCLAMLESMRTSPVAAAAFMMSVARGESVEGAHQRMAAAMNVSNLAVPIPNRTPTADAPRSVAVPISNTPARPSLPPLVPKPHTATSTATTPAATTSPTTASPAPTTTMLPTRPPLTNLIPSANVPRNVAINSSTQVSAIDDFNAGRQLRTVPLKRQYEGENVRPMGFSTIVRYLTPAERAQMKVELREVVSPDGRREMLLHNARGGLYDTQQATSIISGEGRAIFVMNARGELFASNYQAIGEFHHSSLSAGQPVAAAGELVVQNGRIIAITNQSGHYRPDGSYTSQVIDMLRSRGVDLRGVRVYDQTTRSWEVLSH